MQKELVPLHATLFSGRRDRSGLLSRTTHSFKGRVEYELPKVLGTEDVAEKSREPRELPANRLVSFHGAIPAGEIAYFHDTRRESRPGDANAIGPPCVP